MFKILTRLFLALVVLILVGLFVIYGYLPDLLASKIQKSAQVKTSVGKVELSMSEIEINDLVMQNVPNSILPKALDVQEIAIKGPITDFFKKKVQLEEILIDNLYLSLEFNSKSDNRGNWTTIINNLNQTKDDPKQTNYVVSVNKVLLKNIKIDLVYKDNPKNIQKIDIKEIELNNLSTDGDFPVNQLTKVIMQQALKQIFSLQNLGNMLKDLLIPDSSNPIFTPLKPFFSLETQIKEALEADLKN
jgi:hypothetical protein